MSPEEAKLVSITEKEYLVIIHLVYATHDNFVGRQIYEKPNCYLHEDAAACLKKAAKMADKAGFRLKVYDAFRPIEAQKALWEVCPDARFVANPYAEELFVPHCRGIAVDLTLVDKDNDKELDMGTPVDHLTPESYSASTDFTPQVLINRMTLSGIMQVAGFDFLPTEWWHFQLAHYKNYPIVKGATDLVPVINPKR